MSIRKIPARFYDREVTLERRMLSTGSFGDVVEDWNTLAENVPATIQPIRVTELSLLEQGKQFRGRYRMFMATDIVEVKNNDRVVDGEITYLIVGIEHHKAARKNVTVGHHFTIYLDLPDSPKS